MLAGNLELRREIKGQLKENLLKYEQNWYKAADAFNKLCRDLVGDLTRISESADFVEAQRNLLIKTAKKIQLQLNQIPSCHSLDACSALELSVKSIEQIIEQAKDRWFALKLEKREQIQPQPLEEHTIAPIRKKELVKITSITPPMINDLRAVERLSFEHPKSESWWRQSHLAPDHRILCAKVGSEVIGFIVYRITTSSVRVLSLAVEPEYRRQGIGKRLINRAKMSLSENRPYFALDVDQGNLDAHNFLKALKIRGRSINPDNTYHFMTKLKIRGAPKDST
jgi:ribosomal protein S18 acetylase RimI-like enzyme